jgi:hypothetical protein
MYSARRCTFPPVTIWNSSAYKYFQIKKSTLDRLQIQLEPTKERVIDLSREIFETRKFIRRLGHFNLEVEELYTMTEKKNTIQPHFETFLEQCVENRNRYYSSLCDLRPCNIVSIFQDQSIEELDSKAILKRIRQKIKTLPEPIPPYYMKESRRERNTEELKELLLVIDEEIRDVDAREAELI